MDRPRTRQELYEQIRRTSRQEFILDEMIRLGFWPAAGVMPHDPADEIRRETEIRREIAEVHQQNRHLYNEEALKREMRKRRIEESRRKQLENKQRRELARQQRAAAWNEKKQKEIGFLGETVSGGLNQTECNQGRLEKFSLPRFTTPEEIAKGMNLSVPRLRFLAFDRKTSRVSHYVRFQIPKKTGGVRIISAPKPYLKAAQEWVLQTILERVPVHPAAHGFLAGHSIVTNAQPHLKADLILNVDLKDFFPSVHYQRVKGLFKSLGYSEAAATVFGLLCTERDTQEVELDGERYFVGLSERRLPQGAPTSPAITNLLCRKLDARLHKLAMKHGFAYTRYADDLTFSASGPNTRNLCNVLKGLAAIVTHEGFTINPSKTRVLRKGDQQEVTGIIVNEKLNLAREVLKKFRAILFQIEKDGPEGKRWGTSPDVIGSVVGFANYVRMVNPEKGAQFQAQVRRIIEKYGWKRVRMTPAKPAEIAFDPAPTMILTSAPPPPEPEEKPPVAPQAPPSSADGKSKKWWKMF
ncbi:MAG: RNA-directed DNA polymerase [Blastocatellia bacterium]|nr:RNA-directed DNA polymerase [Blastocatellia bacterium]